MYDVARGACVVQLGEVPGLWAGGWFTSTPSQSAVHGSAAMIHFGPESHFLRFVKSYALFAGYLAELGILFKVRESVRV